jgi:hypothetical protein
MSKAIEIQAPNELAYQPSHTTVFLAGSIEMGTAEKWQDRIIEELGDEPITFFNPRRDDWDSSWEQKEGNPQFNEQVTWELNALEEADVILLYFDIHTTSPISLLELGLFARSGKMIVCCPEGFWRKGNVDIVGSKYGVTKVKDIEGLIKMTKQIIKNKEDDEQ